MPCCTMSAMPSSLARPRLWLHHRYRSRADAGRRRDHGAVRGAVGRAVAAAAVSLAGPARHVILHARRRERPGLHPADYLDFRQHAA